MNKTMSNTNARDQIYTNKWDPQDPKKQIRNSNNTAHAADKLKTIPLSNDTIGTRIEECVWCGSQGQSS